MSWLITTLACIGSIWVFFRVLLPIAEAILFGFMETLMGILVAGWRKLRVRHLPWLICNPWVAALSRLLGSSSGIDSQTCGQWTYEPPFKLYRIKPEGDM